MPCNFDGLAETTKIAYQRRYESLSKRYAKACLHSKESPTVSGFLIWIDALKDSLKPSSRRQYRHAIEYALRDEGIKIEQIVPQFLRTSVCASTVVAQVGKRTSSQKSKFIKPKYLQYLLDYLSQSKSDNARVVADILIASSYFGLRPIEWSDAKFKHAGNGGSYVLQVKNAKSTHGRSHGQYRNIFILLENNPDELILALRAGLRLMLLFDEIKQTAQEDFYAQAVTPDVSQGVVAPLDLELFQRLRIEEQLKKAREYLAQLYRTHPLLKKMAKSNHITLYSARHQFAANAKKAGLTPEEIAALMGHASMMTHQASYGKRMNGEIGACGVKADKFDMDNVIRLSPPLKLSPFSNIRLEMSQT